MSHAALVSDGLFLIVVLMTLLLVMFRYAVIEALEDAVPAEAPMLNTPVLAPPAPAPHCRSGGHGPPCSPAGAAGQSGGIDYPARHTTAAVPLISPPEVSSGPRWRPVSGPVLVIAGLVIAGVAIAVIGGWMFRSTGHAATVCSHGLSCFLPPSSSVGPSPRFDPHNVAPAVGPVFA